jgi:hypothetical protein
VDEHPDDPVTLDRHHEVEVRAQLLVPDLGPEPVEDDHVVRAHAHIPTVVKDRSERAAGTIDEIAKDGECSFCAAMVAGERTAPGEAELDVLREAGTRLGPVMRAERAVEACRELDPGSVTG